MARIILEGGKPLCGELTIQGSKNAALPILAATLLVPGETVLIGCPDISDVKDTLQLLEHLGCRVKKEADAIKIDASDVPTCEVTDDAAANMRSSMMLLGALIGRKKKAVVRYPGGCVIGSRPINLHLTALRNMGIMIYETPELILCDAQKINSTVIKFPSVSVGATENLILASVLSDETVQIENAACEPEIVHLCRFLRACGASIYGEGKPNITIHGVKQLHAVEFKLPPDRIVSGTYLFAAAATSGELTLKSAPVHELTTVLQLLSETGCFLRYEGDTIQMKAPITKNAIPFTKTLVYPGFPTDLQSQLTALLSIADGTSMIQETIFERRFRVVPQLRKMGASIEISDDVLLIQGKKRLHGAMVQAEELRGSAALVIAGLSAEGTTIIDTDRYLNRGYQNLVQNLQQLGAVCRYDI